MRLPTGRLAYKTSDGETNGQSRIIDAADVLHVPLFSRDGVVGLSPIQQARQSIGLARAAERFGSRFFANYATPSVAIKTEATVDSLTKQKMRNDWEANQSGKNTHRVAILDQGLEIQQLGISQADAQFLETRMYTRSDLAAIFRCPVHMVGDTTKLSNANTENMNLSFVTDTLRLYLSRIEREIERKLLHPVAGRRSEFVVEFDVSERLRGDFSSSMSGYAIGRQWGWLSANDVRRTMGLNEGGADLDVYVSPLNMQDANLLLAPTKPIDETGIKMNKKDSGISPRRSFACRLVPMDRTPSQVWR